MGLPLGFWLSHTSCCPGNTGCTCGLSAALVSDGRRRRGLLRAVQLLAAQRRNLRATAAGLEALLEVEREERAALAAFDAPPVPDDSENDYGPAGSAYDPDEDPWQHALRE